MDRKKRPEPGGKLPAAFDRPLDDDARRLRQSMARLFDIYTEIAHKADEVMTTRCPYKDAKSRCHASFGCRNQYFTRDAAARPVCTGSDKLDYRSAWEV